MTSSPPPVPYEDLASADLTVGRIYKGGPQPHVKADPLNHLIGVGNTGGFRPKTVKTTGATALCVLYSTGVISEWPDGWDSDGNYVYYGDQRKPDKDLLDTSHKGNQLLADVALWIKRGERGRKSVPPLLLFEKDAPGKGRDVRFEGLLVPAQPEGWLTVEHQSSPEGAFTNYKALLRPLPLETLSRSWLNDVSDGHPHSTNAPQAWSRWVATGEVA